MTRDDLIERIARRTRMSRCQAETLVCTIFDSMEQSLRQGERIEIRGFGTFQVRSYKGYKGRNPKTGNPVEVAPKLLPFFKVSKNLAAGVNGGRKTKTPGVETGNSERFVKVMRGQVMTGSGLPAVQPRS